MLAGVSSSIRQLKATRQSSVVYSEAKRPEFVPLLDEKGNIAFHPSARASCRMASRVSQEWASRAQMQAPSALPTGLRRLAQVIGRWLAPLPEAFLQWPWEAAWWAVCQPVWVRTAQSAPQHLSHPDTLAETLPETPATQPGHILAFRDRAPRSPSGWTPALRHPASVLTPPEWTGMCEQLL